MTDPARIVVMLTQARRQLKHYESLRRQAHEYAQWTDDQMLLDLLVDERLSAEVAAWDRRIAVQKEIVAFLEQASLL